MGLIDNFGAVASSYMEQKQQLVSAEERRKRTRSGHGFWPHEVLRDTLILGKVGSRLSETGARCPLR